jgi:hypothetical protein
VALKGELYARFFRSSDFAGGEPRELTDYVRILRLTLDEFNFLRYYAAG